MTQDTLRQVLRLNVLKFLVEDRPLKTNESGVQRLVNLGIPNGTVQRLLGAETSIGLDVIEQVAAVLGVAPWRLLRPQVEFTGMMRNEASLRDTQLVAQIQRLPKEQRHAIQAIVAGLTAALAVTTVASPTCGDA